MSSTRGNWHSSVLVVLISMIVFLASLGIAYQYLQQPHALKIVDSTIIRDEVASKRILDVDSVVATVYDEKIFIIALIFSGVTAFVFLVFLSGWFFSRATAVRVVAFTLLSGVGIGMVVSFVAGNLPAAFLLTVMGFAFLQNTVGGMTSRAGKRNSALYFATALMFGAPCFYITLGYLVSQDLSLSLIAPYTFATVIGSLFGAKISMGIEKLFGITTLPEGIDKSYKGAKYITLLILGVICVLVARYSELSWITAQIALLALVQTGTYSLMSRSRNVAKAWYHTFATIINGLAWYFMFRTLVMHELPLTLLPAYALGGVAGGLAAQRLSMMYEKTVGAVTDNYLDKSMSKWHWVLPATLVLIPGLVFSVLYKQPAYAFGVIGLAVFQNISFSIISRARNRGSMILHAGAAVLSNGVWYMTFRVLATRDLPLDLLPSYLAGSIAGSLIGIAISIVLERLFEARSDDHVLNPKVS